MNFFRNPEIKKSLLLCCGLSLLFVCAGLFISLPCGVLIAVACAALCTYHFVSTYTRYKKIAALSQLIDSVLHGGKRIDFTCYTEGELSVLQNEIAKMTATLCEHRDSLTFDKIMIMDSIADISHQLKTPLTSMNLIISFLSRSELSDERRLQLAKELERLTRRIDWLVSSLLKLSKLDAGTVKLAHEQILLCDIVKKAASPLAIPMELREQELILQSSGDETMLGDISWTVEAVGNILKNCMEHTPANGTITVACCENAIYSELVITDTGSGLKPDDIPHLFERFYKGADSDEQSIGIGLALARRIITEQNGTIKADNAPSGGARFTIRFFKGIV